MMMLLPCCSPHPTVVWCCCPSLLGGSLLVWSQPRATGDEKEGGAARRGRCEGGGSTPLPEALLLV